MRARVTKTFCDSGIRDQIQVALAVADLDVFEAVPFFRQAQENLRKEGEFLRVDAQLAGARAEQIAFDAHDVADVEQLVERILALIDGVAAHIDLEPLAALHQVEEAGLAHAPHGLNASGDANLRFRRRQFFGGLRALRRQDLRYGVREIKALPVRPEPERLNFRARLTRCSNKSSSRDKKTPSMEV